MNAELDNLINQMVSGGILFEEAVREFEKRFILLVVERHRHNLSRASAELGIHRNTLARRLADYQQALHPAPHPKNLASAKKSD